MIWTEKLELKYCPQDTEIIAFTEISLHIQRGSTTVLIGPSGCGKTSFLYTLAGLKKQSNGRIAYGIKHPIDHLAIILQDYGLFPWKTVEENIALGMKLRGLAKEKIIERVEYYLKSLNLLAYRHHYPSQLSGGQKQRVALARSFAVRPQILLMDEPFSSLDALSREKAQELFLSMKQVEEEMTVILVTHSIEEAVYLGDRVLVMSPRPGRIIADIENPHWGLKDYRQSEEFFKLTNFLRNELKRGRITE